jgi:hypothetical protein
MVFNMVFSSIERIAKFPVECPGFLIMAGP